MAEGWGSAAANAALDALVAAYPWAKPHIGAPGAAGTANAAVETTRKQASWAAASAGAVSTNAALTWTNVPASEDWTDLSFWSASSAGTFGFSIDLTANPLVAGDTMNIPSGDVDISLTLAS